ncbi:MAG: hypothetical protein WD100_04660, partial [Tistlia sp.]
SYAELSADNQALPAYDIAGITVVTAEGPTNSPAAVWNSIEVDSLVDKFKLFWANGDAKYYENWPDAGVSVNEANVELANLYVAYLAAGGAPILDAVQTKVGGIADFEARQQSLHDNLLGNLGDGAIVQRFGSDPADDPRSEAAQAYGERAYHEGMVDAEGDYSNAVKLTNSVMWDVAHGIDYPETAEAPYGDIVGAFELVEGVLEIDGSKLTLATLDLTILPEGMDVRVIEAGSLTSLTTLEGLDLSISAEAVDGMQIAVHPDSILTIEAAFEPLGAENQALPLIDIAGIFVDGSNSPEAVWDNVTVTGGEVDKFKLFWANGDAKYYENWPDAGVSVNEANVELANLYVAYLAAGGAPILDAVQTKVGGIADFEARQQSLHDNLLGNLGDGAIVQRFGSDPADDPRSEAAQAYGDRPYHEGMVDGDDHYSNVAKASAVIGWDLLNGVFYPETLPEPYGVLEGANNLNGTAGTDYFFGGGDDDVLIGGAGDDVAGYRGNRADFEISAQADGGVTVADGNLANGDEGTDDLTGVETLAFTDGTVSFGAQLRQAAAEVGDGGDDDRFHPGSGNSDTNFVVHDNSEAGLEVALKAKGRHTGDLEAEGATYETETGISSGTAALWNFDFSVVSYEGRPLSDFQILITADFVDADGNRTEGVMTFDPVAHLLAHPGENYYSDESDQTSGIQNSQNIGWQSAGFDPSAIGSYELSLTVTEIASGTVVGESNIRVEVGPNIVVDAGGEGDFLTIQEAIDAADAGATILVKEGTYAEALSLTKGLTLVAESGAEVFVDPVSGNALTIGGDLAGADVTLKGLTLAGGESGIWLNADADVGTLTLDGVTVEGNSDYGLRSNANALADLVVSGGRFENNGFETGLNGSAHVKLYEFAGAAAFAGVVLVGASEATAQNDRPDYGIELTGVSNPNLANGDPSPDLGTVTFTDVTVEGAFHKNAVAIYNYGLIDGLEIAGLDLSGAETNWGPLFNIDGVEGDIDATQYVILYPEGDAIVAELQGEVPDQSDTDTTIRGTDANERLMGKAGDDVLYGGGGDDELYGADKPGNPAEDAVGNDTLYGGEGDDLLVGGAGDDVAGYLGSRADFEVSALADGGVLVADGNLADGDEGTDTLSGVETLAFSDGTLGFGAQLQHAAPEGEGGDDGFHPGSGNSDVNFVVHDNTDLGLEVALKAKGRYAGDLEAEGATYQTETGVSSGSAGRWNFDYSIVSYESRDLSDFDIRIVADFVDQDGNRTSDVMVFDPVQHRDLTGEDYYEDPTDETQGLQNSQNIGWYAEGFDPGAVGSYELTLTVTDKATGQTVGESNIRVEVGPNIVVDAGGEGDFLTIQEAIDAADAGATILVKEGTYAEALSLTKGLTLVAESGAEVFVDPVSGNALTIGGDLAGADVTLKGLTLAGGESGIWLNADADVGTLTLDGVTVEGNSDYGLRSNANALADLVVSGGRFENNGFETGLNGSAHVKLYEFAGAAAFAGVVLVGASEATAQNDRPDYGIELTGVSNPNLANGDPSPDLGTVTFTDVTVEGAFHKNAVAIYNYGLIDGLEIAGLDLSGAETNWGPLFNIDGVEGDIDATQYVILYPEGDAIVAELQGEVPDQSDTDTTIRGTDANERLMGKAGDDVLYGGGGDDELYGADKPGNPAEDAVGNDTLYGGAGDDLLVGGLGADLLDGGEGNDTVSYARSDAGVTVDLLAGAASGGDAEGDTLVSIENVIGSAHDDVLTGDGGDNLLDGGAG